MATIINSNTLSTFLFFLLFLFLSTAPSLSDPSPSPTPPSVYEILPKYGLPSGLLPSSVKSYTLSDDGSFVIELKSPCYVQFEYLVYYEGGITGTLKYGSITDLKGIKVQRFFLWFDVDEIKVDLPPSESIYFTVGLVNKKLEVDQFQTVHSCRDGKKVECGRPWMEIFKLPPPIGNEIPMLVTE